MTKQTTIVVIGALKVNPGPAEYRYALPLQTWWKPTDPFAIKYMNLQVSTTWITKISDKMAHAKSADPSQTALAHKGAVFSGSALLVIPLSILTLLLLNTACPVLVEV